MQFELTPASTGVLATLAALAVLFVALALAFAWFAWSARQAPISVADGALDLPLPFYGRTLPLASLSLDAARPPGYSVGWFRLNDGSKALLAVTSRRDVLYLPTTEGYVVLLSLAEPRRALDELRAQAARSG